MTITVVFDPPLPSDSPATFNTKAFSTLGDLNDWSTEANALAVEINSGVPIAVATHAATSKTTPVDADELPMSDSAASWGLKKLTWANLKATAKTYFDTLYLGISATAANASELLGGTWTSPGAIGSTTPNSGAFTTLSATGNATIGDAEATDTHTVKGATTVLANSANPALKITQTGSGNAFVVEDAASDTTPFVIDASGNVVAGHTSTALAGPLFQTVSTIAAGLGAVNASADSNGPVHTFAKARGTVGAPTVVLSGDTISRVDFSGHDGTGYIVGARITASVDGTPGTNDMPGRLVFSTTADGASSPTERMRIDSTGSIGFGGSPFTSTKFRLTGTHPSTSVSPIQTYSDPTFPATGITQPTNFYSAPSTASNAGVGYTVATLIHYLASQGTIHADSTVTTQSGFRVDGTLTGATTNYGFYSALAASGAARYNFYAAGDAPNRFVGETLVIGPSGLGYGTGAGGTVTQATSKSTAVTLNKPTGQITMNNAALAAGTEVFFSLTNSLITAYDVVVCNLSVSLGGSYIARCSQTYTGGATIGLKNITAGSLSESPVISFAVIKGAIS